MSVSFKKWRKEHINKKNAGQYLLYAIGEILLITVGVLIAVNVNNKVTDSNHQELRCKYLEELAYTFAFDIKDVEENIAAFERWIPKLDELIVAIENEDLHNLDSLNHKVEIATRFIFFGQRTVTKMEELKFSPIDLIGNTNLTDKILLYQDEDIAFLRHMEGRYNFVDNQVRLYFSKYIFKNKNAIKNISKDDHFLSLIYQKKSANSNMRNNYEGILKKQIEILELINIEKIKNCN